MLTKDTPPALQPEPGAGERVSGLGVLTAFAGAITWLSAYAGVDDAWQILTGIVICGFGITWMILAHILRLSSRRP